MCVKNDDDDDGGDNVTSVLRRQKKRKKSIYIEECSSGSCVSTAVHESFTMQTGVDSRKMGDLRYVKSSLTTTTATTTAAATTTTLMINTGHERFTRQTETQAIVGVDGRVMD